MSELQQRQKPGQYYGVDIIKFVLSIIIIIAHCQIGIQQGFGGNLWYIVNEVLPSATMVFFILASSYLLFRHFDVSSRDKLLANDLYFRKYIFRIIGLYLLWSIPYTIINYLSLYNHNNFGWSTILNFLADFFINGTYPHMWFFTALISSTIVVYYLLQHIQIKWMLLLGAILYVLCMLGRSYYFIGSRVPGLSSMFTVYFKYFSDTINGFFYGIPLVVLGAWLSKQKVPDRPRLFGALCILSILLLTAEGMLLSAFGHIPQPGKNAFIMQVPVGLFAFLFSLQLRLKGGAIFYYARKTSILVYAIHPLFMLLWSKLSGFLGIPTNIYYNTVFFAFTLVSTLVFSGILITLSERKRFGWLKRLY